MANFSIQIGTEASRRSLTTSTGANIKDEMSLITGIYTFESKENFQNYLKELGVPYVLRSLASMATPVITISKDCPVKKNSRGQSTVYVETGCFKLLYSFFRWCMTIQLVMMITVIGQYEQIHCLRATHSSK